MPIDGILWTRRWKFCRVKVTVFRNQLSDYQIFKLDFARYIYYNEKGIRRDSGIETFS